MIISRDEFHRRYWGVECDGMEKPRTRLRYMPVATLLREIKRDAPWRNHEYMFDGSDLATLPLQESTVGIKAAFPDIKTERERLDKVIGQLLADTYEAVPISMDADYPSIFYVEDGFHRIFGAHALGMRKLRCKVTRGKFNLSDSIDFVKLPKLLDMVDKMFKGKTNKEIIALLTGDGIDKEKAKHTTMSY